MNGKKAFMVTPETPRQKITVPLLCRACLYRKLFEVVCWYKVTTILNIMKNSAAYDSFNI